MNKEKNLNKEKFAFIKLNPDASPQFKAELAKENNTIREVTESMMKAYFGINTQ